MLYRNKNTGIELEVNSVIISPDYELVSENEEEPCENIPEEETISEAPVEEAPIEEPSPVKKSSSKKKGTKNESAFCNS